MLLQTAESNAGELSRLQQQLQAREADLAARAQQITHNDFEIRTLQVSRAVSVYAIRWDSALMEGGQQTEAARLLSLKAYLTSIDRVLHHVCT